MRNLSVDCANWQRVADKNLGEDIGKIFASFLQSKNMEEDVLTRKKEPNDNEVGAVKKNYMNQIRPG